MREEKKNRNAMAVCLCLFAVLLAVHTFEALCLRMDETVLGENFINKLFGIALLAVLLRRLEWKWRDIGFAREAALKSAGIGLGLATGTFFVAYAAELLILQGQGHQVALGLFTSGFSLTGGAQTHTGIGFIALCVLLNVINVIMEEGIFRGLFFGLVSRQHPMRTAILYQALLFGVWHIVTPLRSLLDGEMGAGEFLALSAGYVILAGMMGIKWSLLYRMNGNLYAGMSDHFFNNCIASNLLHVVTESGTDELMIVRIATAQLLSFAIVLLRWRKYVSIAENG